MKLKNKFKFNKDFIKRQNYVKFFLKKQILKSFIKNSKISIEERNYLYFKYNKSRYSLTKIKNFCLINKSSKSVYKITKLSRYTFKNMVLNGQLPG